MHICCNFRSVDIFVGTKAGTIGAGLTYYRDIYRGAAMRPSKEVCV
jgi:hypothetical protein